MMLEFGSLTIFYPKQIRVIDCREITDVNSPNLGEWIIVIHIDDVKQIIASQLFEDEESALKKKAEIIELINKEEDCGSS